MTVIEHLPGCNLPHEGGNWQWSCRRQVVVSYQPEHLAAQDVAEVTVEADGPCTGGAAMEISVGYRILGPNDLRAFELDAWPRIQQAITDQAVYLADWDERSQCQHPEDEDCPE